MILIGERREENVIRGSLGRSQEREEQVGGAVRCTTYALS